ncbi:Gastricsin [Cytospora mali]|uniref:Gastricsin n=1 Tax=Cytospora mali TaxID=578113 RepID=A0A194VQJ6_CYTMA|nr:Gastricsin [Valsa mali]
MRQELLAALAICLAEATASTVTLPLRSRARDHQALGDTKFRLPGARRSTNTSSGVNVPVTDWFNRTDNQWYTTFGVGTPPQYLTVLFDTGSPDLLLPESNCTTCGDLTLFNPNKSSTFSPLPGNEINYEFATGADSIPFTVPEGATCRFVHDTVALGTGTLKVKDQEFVLCDSFAEALDVSGISGIMGMSLPFTYDTVPTSWYWHLVDDGQLDSPLYSFYIPPGDIHGGEVTLGGVDESKVDGDIIYMNLDVELTNAYSAYVVDQLAMYSDGTLLTNTSANGTETPLPFAYAVLDTGTAFMQTPDYATAKNIYAQISPKITQIDVAGAWGAPCAEMEKFAPDLTFTFGNSSLALNVTIPKEYFNLGEYPGQPGICQAVFNNPYGSLDSQWFYNGTPAWLIGSPLLDKYYTVWDGVDLRIGWGKLYGLPGF